MKLKIGDDIQNKHGQLFRLVDSPVGELTMVQEQMDDVDLQVGELLHIPLLTDDGKVVETAVFRRLD